MRLRFVTPEGTGRIFISDGDWIELKKQLTVYERDGILNSGLVRAPMPVEGNGAKKRAPGTFDYDIAESRAVKLSTWLLDWSFQDAQGKKTDPTLDNCRAIDPETAKEIEDQIDALVKAAKEGPTNEAAEKKASTGEPVPDSLSTPVE